MAELVDIKVEVKWREARRVGRKEAIFFVLGVLKTGGWLFSEHQPAEPWCWVDATERRISTAKRLLAERLGLTPPDRGG